MELFWIGWGGKLLFLMKTSEWCLMGSGDPIRFSICAARPPEETKWRLSPRQPARQPFVYSIFILNDFPEWWSKMGRSSRDILILNLIQSFLLHIWIPTLSIKQFLFKKMFYFPFYFCLGAQFLKSCPFLDLYTSK